MTVPVDAPQSLAGQQVTLGIRPEHLVPAETGLPATISVVEPTGPETHLMLKHGAQELVAVMRERRAFRPGEVLHLVAVPGAVHVFDRATQAAI